MVVGIGRGVGVAAARRWGWWSARYVVTGREKEEGPDCSSGYLPAEGWVWFLITGFRSGNLVGGVRAGDAACWNGMWSCRCSVPPRARWTV